MIRFILRRILETIPVLWAVATLTFFMLRLAPGGPFDDERQVSPEVLRTLQAHYGLDKPLIAQYGDYLLNLVQGDLGPSFKYPGRTVNEIIRDSFPNSMELGFYSMTIALALGLTLGILASLKPNSMLDYLPSSMAMVGICLPTFVLGPLLVLVFALKRSEEHTSELQSRSDLVCRLLLEKKKDRHRTVAGDIVPDPQGSDG